MAAGLNVGAQLKIAIGFPAEMFERIDKMAWLQRRSFAAMVRILIDEALEHRARRAEGAKDEARAL